MTMNDDAHELALRAHIRELLLDYAYTHLTVDHVQYSETTVAEMLPKILKPIPTHGPGDLALPVDPFDTLRQKLKFDTLQPYDEVWQPSPEAFQLLKQVYMPSKEKIKSHSIWEDDDGFDYDSMPHRPMSPPLLSRTSRRKTPSLGKAAKGNKYLDCLASTLSSHGVRKVADENLPEEKVVKLDECLDLKLTIDAAMHSGMLEFQRQIPFLGRPTHRAFPLHALDFLRSRSPEYKERFRPISPPIFARERTARPSKKESDGNILGPMKFVPLEVEEEDLDFATESMKVIDGWATLPSSASTPSLSSGTSEVDELDEDSNFWRPSSSDGVPPAIEMLEAAKMEEPIFARADRPRTGRCDKKNEMHKQSLSSFISAHLPSNAPVRIRTTPNSDDALPKPDHSPPPSVSGISISMLGQPPSEPDMSSAPPSDSVGDTFDKDIRRILKVHGANEGPKSYQDIILDERLDEKETMFMEVPKLPPPNDYLRRDGQLTSSNRLSTISDSLTKKGPMERKFSLPTTFKKATGLKSLNLELSWRPFTFGSKIPTHSELVGVESLFSDESDLPDGEGAPSQETIEKFLADLACPTELDDKSGTSNLIGTAQDNFSYDHRILEDVLHDSDSGKLDPRLNPNRDFYEDTLLLSRSDRNGVISMPTYALQNVLADESVTFNDVYSNETSDFSSAITPEFDGQFPQARDTDDSNAYIDTFAYTRDYSPYQDHDDFIDSREVKKRRLTNAELDALCAMGTVSQSLPDTIDPRHLTLPRLDGRSIPTYGSQLSFVPSQSLSLSLSLNEDFPSQEFNTGTAADTTLGCTDDDNGACISQTRMLHAFDDIAKTEQADLLLDSQQDAFMSSPQSAGLGESIARDAPYRPLDIQALDRVPPNNNFPDDPGLEHSKSLSKPDLETEHDYAQSNKQKLSCLTSSSTLLTDTNKLSGFLLLRGRKIIPNVNASSPERDKIPQKDETHHDVKDSSADQTSSLISTHGRAPSDLLLDTRAFSIPDPWRSPVTEHTYLVSVDFVQQRALVHILQSPRCSVRLVERDVITPFPVASSTGTVHSADVSIIIGPHSGVVFFSLSALPSQIAYKTLLDALAAHSWRFSSILLVLMGFPRTQLMRAVNTEQRSRDGPSSYSPPTLKAARRVRRDLALREGTGEKRASCSIELAFADDVEQAALFVRAFGDLALKDSVVDFTQYIGEEEQEGERDLMELEGMNAFCAAAILRCCTLEEFLEMPPEERTEGLADIIGKERIEHVNAVLSSRMEAMDMEASSELVPSLNE